MSDNKLKKFKTVDLAYMGLGTALIVICSWISVPMTIPITLQTMAVCLVAGLLGAKRGTLSLMIYLVLAAIGLPVLSGFKGGIGAVAGPTGGYLIGFIFTSLIVGLVVEKSNRLWAITASMVVGIIILYAFGTLWFAVAYAKQNNAQTLMTILGWCVFPFILPDAIKITIAALLTKRLKKYVK